jgi:alpha-beta hydrolase superfamily lysophospholipase
MRERSFELRADDGAALHVYRFEPESAPAKAVVQIEHGMAEHAARYRRVAEALTAAGYAVYADDHRGHGKSARGPEDLGFFAQQDGWNRVVRDFELLRERIVEDHPKKPVFLLGHSMGSLLAQSYVAEHGRELAGLVLSGTGGGSGPLVRVGRVIAKLERLRLGPAGRSKLLQTLTFGAYNKGFAPNRTAYDWLSRDAAEVDAYIADPLCGFDFTVQGWIDIMSGVIAIESEATIAKVPKALPVYLMSGALDPVGRQSAGVKWLAEQYRKAGLADVTVRLYEGARHELFNETHRDEVLRELVAWLDGVLARRAAPAS